MNACCAMMSASDRAADCGADAIRLSTSHCERCGAFEDAVLIKNVSRNWLEQTEIMPQALAAVLAPDLGKVADPRVAAIISPDADHPVYLQQRVLRI